jgi:multicomponent Na+:H+ antiporter subunit C
MTRAAIYGAAGVLVFAMSIYAMIAHRDLIRRIIAANAMGTGVFLVFGAIAVRSARAHPDPVPHAMVLTGIVVAFSATAIGLRLVVGLHASTGQARLPEDESPEVESPEAESPEAESPEAD